MTKAKTYQITPSGRIYKDGVEIPPDDRTAAWRAYAAWLAKGNGPSEIEEIDAPADDAAELGEIDAELTRLEARIERLRQRKTTKEDTP